MYAFCKVLFSYCHLIWMCHSHKNYKRINKLDERCLRIIHNDILSSFKELREDDSVFTQQQNLQVLATHT